MSTRIRLKNSSTPGAIPSTGDLVPGELAVNTFDGKLYTLQDDGVTPTIKDITGIQYVAGGGISIAPDNTISSTTQSAGNVIAVQVSDRLGGFAAVPGGGLGRVLTSQGADEVPTWEPLPETGTVTSVDISTGTTGLIVDGSPITTAGTITLSGTLSTLHGGTGANNPTLGLRNLLPTQTGAIPGSTLTTDGAGNVTWEIPPGAEYTAGIGLQLSGTTFNSVVADNLGNVDRIQLSNGDGTLKNFTFGLAGQVLTSQGLNQPPVWGNPSGTVTSIDLERGGAVGLYISGGDATMDPETYNISTTATLSLDGVLNITNGGTNATTRPAALNNLLPDQTGSAGYVLTTDGAGVVTWTVKQAGVTSVDVAGGSTGMTFNGGPIVDDGIITMSGVLNIANGGTGASNASDAINALVPAQTGNQNRVLGTDGTSVSWVATSQGTITGVSIDPGTTGLSFGGPFTSDDAAFAITGSLSIGNGGTGASSVSGAIANLLPPQATNAGKVLTTDGSEVSWSPVGLGTVTSVEIGEGPTGLFGDQPITTSGEIILDGILVLEHGGTGADNRLDAINNLLPPQAGSSGKVLRTDGTDATWEDELTQVVPIELGGTGQTTASAAINVLVPSQAGNSGRVLSTDGTVVSWTSTAAGTVRSVDVSGGLTGMTFSGGPVTDTGVLTLSGTLGPEYGGTGGMLPIENGGTGATTAEVAANNLLPAQTLPVAGYVLTTDGEGGLSWTIKQGGVTSVDVSGGVTGLTFTGGPVTTTGTLTASGVLSIASGGTGETSAKNARLALLPPITGNANRNLRVNGVGDDVIWVDAAEGTVTSVGVGGGTTGLSSSNVISTTGNLILTGTLALEHGGTGASTRATALNNLLPSQTSNAGKFLATNGTNAAWTAFSDANLAGGANTTVQFNNNGQLAGTTDFTYNNSTLTAPGLVITVSGAKITGQYSGNVINMIAGTTVDCSAGNYFTKTITAPTVFTFANPPSTGNYIFVLRLQNGGSQSITWPGTVVWPNATAPTLTSGGYDLLLFATDDAGTTWRGASLLNYSA